MDFPGTRARKTVYGAWHARLGSSEHREATLRSDPHNVLLHVCNVYMHNIQIQAQS